MHKMAYTLVFIIHSDDLTRYVKTHKRASVFEMGNWQADQAAEKANTRRPFFMLKLCVKTNQEEREESGWRGWGKSEGVEHTPYRC